MALLVKLSLVFVFCSCSGALMRENSNHYYFTGQGCGTSSPIKYFDEIPTETSQLSCAFVKKQNSLVRKSTKMVERCPTVSSDIYSPWYDGPFIPVDGKYACMEKCQANPQCKIFMYRVADQACYLRNIPVTNVRFLNGFETNFVTCPYIETIEDLAVVAAVRGNTVY